MEVVAPVIAVVLVIGVVALVVSAALWLIFFTPVVKWAFLAVVAFLSLRLVLLPFQTGTRVLEEELRSKVDVAFTTSFGPGRYFNNLSLNVTGTITNNADRPIRQIFIACRVSKLSFDSYELARNHLSVLVKPGQTESFGGMISDRLTGVDKPGFKRLQAPDRHFCRLDQVDEGSK